MNKKEAIVAMMDGQKVTKDIFMRSSEYYDVYIYMTEEGDFRNDKDRTIALNTYGNEGWKIWEKPTPPEEPRLPTDDEINGNTKESLTMIRD